MTNCLMATLRRRREHLCQRIPFPGGYSPTPCGRPHNPRGNGAAGGRHQNCAGRCDQSGRHYLTRLCERGWRERLLQAEAICLRAERPAVPQMPDADPPVHTGRALDVLLPRVPEMRDRYFARLACSAFATSGCTNWETLPPRLAISRTSVDEMKLNCSVGVRKT